MSSFTLAAPPSAFALDENGNPTRWRITFTDDRGWVELQLDGTRFDVTGEVRYRGAYLLRGYLILDTTYGTVSDASDQHRVAIYSRLRHEQDAAASTVKAIRNGVVQAARAAFPLEVVQAVAVARAETLVRLAEERRARAEQRFAVARSTVRVQVAMKRAEVEALSEEATLLRDLGDVEAAMQLEQQRTEAQKVLENREQELRTDGFIGSSSRYEADLARAEADQWRTHLVVLGYLGDDTRHEVARRLVADGWKGTAADLVEAVELLAV